MEDELLQEIAEAAEKLYAKLRDKIATRANAFDPAFELTKAAMPAITEAIINTPRYIQIN